ncbi:MAG: hypothetical protein ABR598_03885, partial [Candidatus Dormibacteria bacterium]
TNNGPSDATGVVVTDLLPAGLTLVSTTPSQGGYNSGTGVWTVGAIGSGAAATLQVVATVTTPGVHTNTATKTGEDQFDPTTPDAASATVDGQQADIGVNKTVDNATPNVGTNVTFTVTATNHGPSNATGVVVTDLLPAGLTFVSATPSQGTYVSGTGAWTVGAMANGAASTLQIVATVTGPGQFTNIATRTAEDQTDGNAANDSSSATVTTPSADIGVVKTVDNASVPVGQNATFTITATNHGPTNATGVVVTDLLPAGLTFVSATPSQGTYTSATGAWNVGALANGAGATLQLVATVTTPGVHTNTATKTGEDQPDPNPGNDSASASVNALQADMAVTKTVDNATPTVGQNVTFTVTATNNGPNDASGVVLTDLLPAGLTFVSATPSQGTYTSGTGAWALGSLANGASATLSVVATATQAGTITNTASLTHEDQADPTPADDSASATINPRTVDLMLQKALQGTLTAGQQATYALTVTNKGQAPTFAPITVTDPLPAALGFVAATGSGWTCGAQGQVVTCTNLGPMAVGATSTITLVVRVASDATGNIVNGATVSTAGDIVVSNNSDSFTGVVSSAQTPPPTAPKLPSAGRAAELRHLQVSILMMSMGLLLLVISRRRARPSPA